MTPTKGDLGAGIEQMDDHQHRSFRFADPATSLDTFAPTIGRGRVVGVVADASSCAHPETEPDWWNDATNLWHYDRCLSCHTTLNVRDGGPAIRQDLI